MAERHDRPRGLPFAQRLQNLRRDAWWFVVRIIQRLLSGSRGEVSALEQALRLQERVVIVAMVGERLPGAAAAGLLRVHGLGPRLV